MPKQTKVEPVSNKIKLQVWSSTKATILRPGMPFIDDGIENAVKWLAAQKLKAEDIEIIGEKPACWDGVFKTPEAVPEAVPETPVDAPVA